MRASTFLKARSGRTYLALIGACTVAAAVLGYAHYRSSIGWFEKNRFEEKVGVLRLVEAFVASYAEIRSKHLPDDAPVPATFRAHSVARFSNDNRTESALQIDWFGLPGRQIQKAPADPLTAKTLLEYAESRDLMPRSHWHESDGQPVFRTIAPSAALHESCVECHNRYVTDGRLWQVGEVMGAFVLDVPAGAFLSEARREAALLAISFFGLGSLVGLTILRLQRRLQYSDVTAATAAERERKREELESSRRLLQTIIDQLPARISVKDADLRYILVNKAQAEEFGCAPAAALGKRRTDFTRGDLRDGSRNQFFASIVDRDHLVLETGQPILNFEEHVIRKSGASEHSLSSKAPLFDAAGRAVGVLTVAVDITVQKDTEARLREAMRVAEDANRMKSEFLANMSHELRTPLNAILGFSEVIRDALFGPVAGRYREYARDIHKSGSHLLNLINDVLDLSKIEAGRMELALAPHSIEEIVTTCHRMIAERAKRGGVTVDLVLQPSLPKATVDGLRVQQILLNLLSNAVKFTPNGGRVIVYAMAQPDAVSIVVEDTGIGMKSEDIAVAFEPFRQVDGSLSRRYEGTGLGLPLARRLAEMHGGRLEIESEFGKGTTATIVLPLAGAARVA